MTGPITRIILRYASGALVTYGLVSPDVAGQIATDPDIALIVGMAVGAATEAFYVLAKRLGLAT